MQKISGIAPFGSTVTVRTDGGRIASVYADQGGLVALANPLAVPASGAWEAHIADGIYFVTTTPPNGSAAWRQVMTVGNPAPGALPGVMVLAQQNTQVVAPADTNESTLFSFALPGGLLGPNDSLRIGAHMSCDNNANSKILRVRFGGSIALSSGTVTTAAYSHMSIVIANRNSRSAQTTRVSYSYAGANGGPLAINTAVDQLITVTIQKGVATDNAALESVMVEWLPAAG